MRSFLYLVACVLSSANVLAQTGQIRLQLTDPSGAAVQASGRLTDAGTGARRVFHTTERGSYVFSSVAPGHYELSIAQPGFAPYTSTVNVTSATPVIVNVTLALAAATYRIDVAAPTPLPGTSLPLDEIPSPIQTAGQLELEQSGALDMSDFLNRRFSGIHVNEIQNNPYQPDVNYRGYTASSLLGTPEGISVYMDGVRMNQPFGDIVTWDLLPKIAISEAALMPGSNPLFGLNTLGGALSLQTKDGASAPGTSLQVTGGSYNRRAVAFENGGANRHGFNWYVAGNLFHDDGWRVDSPTDVRQLFAKLGWQSAKTTVSLTFAYADNELAGNGLQEQRFLSRDYSSIYTKPDITNNRSPFLNLSLRHALSPGTTLAGNAYYRYIRSDTFNADLNTDSLDQSVYTLSTADAAALRSAGYAVPSGALNAANTPFPSLRCIAQALQHADPEERCDGLLTRSYTKQKNYGVSGQVSASPKWWRRAQLIAGAGFDGSDAGFQQFQQFAFMNPDLGFTAVNAFADGSTSVGGAPYDTRINLQGTVRTVSLYGTGNFPVGSRLTFNVSGRYNHSQLNNLDLFAPKAAPGSLTSSNRFERLNPSAGLTYRPTTAFQLYFSYSEGNRAPTSIELGCADPTQPCKLPNSMAGDPPLQQVITRTFEAGVRSSAESLWNWQAGWFRAQNHNDILFVSSTQTGYGYFRNFGVTRREGVEAHLSRRIRRVTIGGNYTYLDATYQSTETLSGSGNSTNDAALAGQIGMDGVITVHPGNRIPLVPNHLLKAFADARLSSKLSADLDVIAVSSSFARGNENNLSQGDGKYYLGPGTSPGYAVVNFAARYHIRKQIEVVGQINNLLDRHYFTAAQLGPTGFTAAETFIARPFPAVNGDYPIQHSTFYAPGAPRSMSGGVRFTF